MVAKRPLETEADTEAHATGVLGASEVPQEVLDCFWNLASNDVQIRSENAYLLTKHCERAEDQGAGDVVATESLVGIDESFRQCSALTRYCLKRLIKGLSSSRQSARQGFSLALSGIVGLVFRKVKGSVNMLLSFMRSSFSKKDGQDIIGHIFGIGSLVKSDIPMSTEDVICMSNDLLELAESKSFVTEACVEVMVELAYRTRKDTEEGLVQLLSSPKLEEIISSGEKGSHLTPEMVTLLIYLWPLMPKDIAKKSYVVPKGVPGPSEDVLLRTGSHSTAFSGVDSRASAAFFRADHVEKIRLLLKNTTYCHPRAHSCWFVLLKLLVPGYGEPSLRCTVNVQSLANFWNIMVEKELFNSSSHEKKYLGILLFKELLPCLKDDAISSVITPTFIKCLGNNSNKQTYLNKASNQALQKLSERVKELPSQVVDELTSKISDYSGNQLGHYFKNNFNATNDDKSMEGLSTIVNALNSCTVEDKSYVHHLPKVPGIVKKFQNQPEVCNDLFKSLIDAYLIEGESSGESDEELRDRRVKIIGALMNGIGILSKAHNSMGALVGVERKLLNYLTERLDRNDAGRPAEILTKFRVSSAVASKDVDSRKVDHFLHLIYLLEIYSYANPETFDEDIATDLISTFEECFQEKKGKKKKKAAHPDEEENVYWADVLVDCILSILSRNESPYPSAPLRDAGELLFRYFTDDMTSAGISSLLDVLVQEMDMSNQNEEDMEDEAESGEEEEDEDVTGDDDSDHSENDSGEDSDVDVADMEVDAEIPDATDEQMFQMDSMLGAYFANHTKKSKKQIQDDMINFKLRVISCAEMFMRRSPDSALLIEFPIPLLISMGSASRPEGSRVLQERLSGLIRNKLVKCKCQELAKSSTLDVEMLEQQLRKSLYLASRSPVRLVADCATATYIFLQKCLRQIDDDSISKLLDDSAIAAVDDYFSKKKSKLTKAFFPELFRKVPDLVQVSLPALIEQCSSARSVYLQNEAFIMVGNALQALDDDDVIGVFKSIQQATAKMIESSKPLLTSGKKKEIRKVIRKAFALIDTAGGEKKILGKCAAPVKDVKAMLDQNGQSHDREATDAATKLLQKLADSFSVEDRRQAASDLRDVLLDNPNAKSTISSFGLETVCSTIRSDWNNGQVVRNCLESLAIVVDTSYSKNFAESRVNAEQLARTPGALGLLFDSLEYSQDSGQDQFHVKYFGLQILKSIFETNRAFTQQAALRHPNSITAPLKLFKEQEVLRNDAILLLQCIVFESKVAQDVAVREGCLDLLFDIYQNEDPQINYAVIEDSLTLLRYVLQDNLDSQAIFCSSNRLRKVISSLEMKLDHPPPQMSVEDSRILSSETSLLFPFLASGTLPNELTAILHKNAGEKSPRLLHLLLNIVQYQGQIHDFSFSATAWDCLLEISLLPTARQDVLESKINIQGHPVPIHLGSLYITLTTPDCIHQLSAMRFCVHSLWRDEKMQDQCLQQLLNSANLTVLIFGQTKTMLDILQRSRIFVALAPLCAKADNRAKVEGIKKGEMSLIKFCVDVLIKAILEHGKATESPEICLNCCVFLAAVTQASPVAVEEFLRSISERPFLVGVLLSESKFGENEKMLKGICSFLIGIALNAPASSAVDSKVLKDTIENKIGLTSFFGHLNFILDQTPGSDREFLFNGVIPKSLLKNLSEQVKAKFYPSSKETISAPINGHAPESHPKISKDISKAADIVLDSPKEEIQNLRAENELLKKRIEEERESKKVLEEKLKHVEDDLQALSQAYSALDEHSNNLQRHLDESKDKPPDDDLDAAMEDLLACLGQAEEKNARLLERLRSMGVTDIE